MIQMFLSDIGYEFDETEINRIVKGTHDQREIMNRTIQILAEKITEEKYSQLLKQSRRTHYGK